MLHTDVKVILLGVFFTGSTVSGFVLFSLAQRYNFPKNIIAKYVWGFVGGLIGGWYVARTAGSNCLGYLMQSNTPLAREVEEIIRERAPNYYMLDRIPIFSEEERLPSISQMARDDPARLAQYQDPNLYSRSGVQTPANSTGAAKPQTEIEGSPRGGFGGDFSPQTPPPPPPPVQTAQTQQREQETQQQEESGMSGIFQFDEQPEQSQQTGNEQGRRGYRSRLPPPPPPQVSPQYGQPARQDNMSSDGGLIIKEEDEFQKGFEEDSYNQRSQRGGGGRQGGSGGVLGEFS
eukprot:TRINITY_DN49554_c0_g1_i2.p1 TRINITY_DN49554_c0_g1~~TRINITY_DN49554_c0_g1_i2.p1  ORF type:complete len:290 (+),score=48.12 TRINITY_DN49554_c0_g1_i2:186-1055(+)